MKRKRHWWALFLLSHQSPEAYSISSILRKRPGKKIPLSERQIRKLIARFEEEGIAYLERPYRHQSPLHKGRGRKPTLSPEELPLLLHPDLLGGSLKDVQAWIQSRTGKKVSLATASRLRAKALKAYHETKAKTKKKPTRKQALKSTVQGKQLLLFPIEEGPTKAGEPPSMDSS